MICYNCGMKDWNQIISNNISKYRKMSKLTQSELAEKLSFSDKSISKWERGDAIPDVTVLIQMSEIFGITLNDMVSEEIILPKSNNVTHKNHLIISMISAGVAWLVATFVFVAFLIFLPSLERAWLSFIYAIPVSTIVLLVFACIWGRRWQRFALISILIWSVILSICLTFNTVSVWDLFYIGIPLQILTILWWWLDKNIKKGKIK